MFVVSRLVPHGSGTSISGRLFIVKLESKIVFKVRKKTRLLDLISLSKITSVRLVGDPVPFNPPIPYLPFLCDTYYHVGFGITLENFTRGRSQINETL